MEKKICPNGHEYDPAVNGFCPVCGQAAQAAQTDSMTRAVSRERSFFIGVFLLSRGQARPARPDD